jgi:LacI family transcriptional regulator
MKTKITIKDVAKKACVSVGTVSNVINKKKNVDPELYRKVNEVMQELGYQVNMQARGMILKRSFNIGIVIPTLQDPFFPRFAEYLEELIEQRGSHVIITSSKGEAGRERQVIASLQNKLIDGIIITPSNSDNIETINAVIASGTPVVQLGRYYHDITAPIVRVDNEYIGSNAADRMIGAGCKNILLVCGAQVSNPDICRTEGFLHQIRTTNPKINCRVIKYSDRINSDLKNALSEQPDIDGIFTIDDSMAMNALKVCFSCGKNVPDDISIISGASCYPTRIQVLEFSSYELEPKQMATEALALLFQAIDAKEKVIDATPQVITIQPKPIQGETLRGETPPPGSNRSRPLIPGVEQGSRI